MNAAWGETLRSGRTRRLAVALAPMVAGGVFLAWFSSAVFVFIIALWKQVALGAVLSATASYALWCRGRGWFETESPDRSEAAAGLRARVVLRHAGRLAAAWIGALVLSVGIIDWSISPHPPSDASMRRRFTRHREDLERLAAMADEDRGMTRIAPEFTHPEDGRPPEARLAEYRRLFRRAGIGKGLARWSSAGWSSPSWSSPGDAFLLVWTWGMLGGRTVGYVHCARRSGASDACFGGREFGRVDAHGDGYRFLRLAPDWYLVEEWD